MATAKQVLGTRTSHGMNASLATLANGNYAVSSTAYDCTTNQPVDVIVEADIVTTNTPANNKQAVVFIKESIDGTNFRSGPESGSTTTDEPDLRLLGVVPMNTAGTHIGLFSVMQALGFVPAKFKVIVKNDCGVALTTGSAVYTSEVSVTST